jgi:hypothetical protein
VKLCSLDQAGQLNLYPKPDEALARRHQNYFAVATKINAIYAPFTLVLNEFALNQWIKAMRG